MKRWNRMLTVWEQNRRFLIGCFVLSCILIFITESAFRFSLVEGLKLVYRRPFDFLVGTLALTAAASLLSFLTNRPKLSTGLVFVLYTLLSGANLGLRIFRSATITPRDLLLAKEVFAIGSELFSPKIVLVFCGLLLLVLAVLFAAHRISKPFVKSKLLRLESIRIAIPLFLVVAMAFGIRMRFNDTFLIRFFAGTGQMLVANQGTRVYADLIEGGKPLLSPASFGDRKPNIIIIQSEAFWDPMRIGSIFNRDPVPNFRKIREQTIHGDMLVPVFGGGTCNTEYEILTGGSVRAFLWDPWYLIFPNEIKAPIQSAASILRNQGYHAYGNHPFMNWYFNRRQVYRHLGFHEFRTLEYMREAIRYTDVYVPDSYFTTELVRQIRETEAPVFSFSVTMQNHGPYEYDRFGDDKPDVSVRPSELVTENARFFLTNYAQGVALSDEQLPLLLEAIRKLDEPTVVLFYGDHLPMLGTNYLAFREGKYISTLAEEGSEDLFRLKSVPYFLWSNFDDSKRDLGTLNSYYLLPLLLRYCGLDVPDNMLALEASAAHFPTFDGATLTDSLGIRFEPGSEEFELYRNFLNDYRKMLFGKTEGDRVLLSDQTGDHYNPEYNTALDDVRIESANGDLIRGHNLYHGMIVLVDGQAVEADYLDRNTIRLNESLPAGARTVQVELRDSNNDLLTASPLFHLR